MDSSEQIDTNLAAILGLIIGGGWLLYTSLLVTYKKNVIKVAAEWFNRRKVVLPALTTLILSFLFTYFSQEIPKIIKTWNLGDFVGVFGAIIGTSLGFLLSEFRQWTTEGKQAERVQTMLKLEIDQNISLLRDFWNQFSHAYIAVEQNANLVQSLLAIPMPQWNRRVWESQVSLVPIALSEEEIKKVNSFYSKLDEIIERSSKITLIASNLANLETQIDERIIGSQAIVWGRQLETIRAKIPERYQELEEVVGGVISSANQLL